MLDDRVVSGLEPNILEDPPVQTDPITHKSQRKQDGFEKGQLRL